MIFFSDDEVRLAFYELPTEEQMQYFFLREFLANYGKVFTVNEVGVREGRDFVEITISG